ncbi:TonB-dependent receptor [bacterium]|nr:MAG: TonB-dependent receptor [bacterium]
MKLVSFIYILLICVINLNANTSANLSGTVYYKYSGKPVSEAKIFVRELQKTINADQDGHYSFNLNRGDYTLIASTGDVSSYPKTISVDKTKKVDLAIDTMITKFDDIIVEEKKSNRFGMSNLLPVDGAAIYAGRKSEALYLDNITANLASNNARQVFSKFSGLNIWENDASGIQLNIGGRGLSPNRVSNFNTRQNGYDIAADALGYPESYYTPPMEALEKIELVRGAASLQYGTQFGGFLNFKLKDGSKLKPVDIITRQSISSYDNFNSFNSIGGTYDNMNYYTFLQYKKGNDFRPNSDYNALTFYIKNAYKITEDLSVTAEFTHMNYLSKQSGGLTDAMFYSNPDQSVRNRNWFSVDWNIMAAIIDYKLSSSVKINSRTFYLDANRDALGYMVRPDRADPNEDRDLLKGTFENLGNESRLLFTYSLEDGLPSTFLTGIRIYKGITKQRQGYGTDNSDANFEYIDNNSMLNDYTNPSSNYALFAENLFKLSNRFTLTPGIRYENITTGSKGYYRQIIKDLAGNIISNDTFNENMENKRDFVLFGLSAGYALSDEVESYVNISQNYRAVTFNDMRVVNPNIRIDNSLTDENGYSGDIGVRGTAGKLLYFDLNFYYLYYFDKIGSVLKTDEKTYVPYLLKTNISDSRSVGFEIFTETNLNTLFGYEASYELNYFINASYTNAVFLNSKETAFDGKKVEYSPPLIVRTGFSYKQADLSASITYSYTMEQFSDATNAVSAPGSITGIIPSYNVLDLSLSYNFGLFKLESGINNLLDESYFTRRATGYPGPGIIPAMRRSIYLTIGVNP